MQNKGRYIFSIIRSGILFCLILCSMPSLSAQTEGDLRSGDLLFVRAQQSAMEQAIAASTGNYTHVALVERDSTGRLFLIEAIPSAGVHRIPYTPDYGPCERYRLAQPFDTAAVIRRAKAYLGLPYDQAFQPGDQALYCSELIYYCFLDADGRPLFEAIPMNFRNARGRLPRYWRRHFKRLGLPVPEQVPGTNPTDLAHSPLLIKLP